MNKLNQEQRNFIARNIRENAEIIARNIKNGNLNRADIVWEQDSIVRCSSTGWQDQDFIYNFNEEQRLGLLK